MRRLLPSLFLLLSCGLSAQSIVWISDCSDKTFCLNQNSCAQGNVFMTQQAVTNCNFGGGVSYSYRIDLNNNGSTDINSAEDTVNTNFAAGTHKISWKATDNCGNISSCTYLFTVKDCQPPSLLCINGLTQSLDAPECTATFVASTFILNTSDNCTPTNQIQVGIRKFGTGTGFPTETTVSYAKCEAGTNFVEIWVRDANGLTNSCQNYVLVQPNNSGCSCDPFGDIQLNGCVKTISNKKLAGYTLSSNLVSTAGVQSPISKIRQKVTTDSCSFIGYDKLTFGGSYRMKIFAGESALSNDHLNGVSTFDLLQISRHILGIQPFQTTYQLLAADVNRSKSVTTFDIVEARKLILGIYDSLPGIPAWRIMVPMTEPSNLGSTFTTARDTYQLNLTNLLADTALYNLDFIAIKYGDVNQNATFGGEADDRDAGDPLPLFMEAAEVAAGTKQRIPFWTLESSRLDGWQIALKLDLTKLQLESIEGVPAENYHIDAEGVLRILSWNVENWELASKAPLFVLHIKVLNVGTLQDMIQMDAESLKPEGYNLEAGTDRRPITLQYVFPQKTSAGVQCYMPFPNPFTATTSFQLQLNVPQTAHLAVFDFTGKQVYQKVEELAAGTQWLEVPAAAFASPGAFVYRLQLGNEQYTGKFIKL